MGWFDKKIEGKNASKWFELGYKATDPEENIRCYDNALKLDPKNESAWINKGVALGKLGKYDEAIKCYNKALDLNPRDETAWNNKGNAFYNMRKYEDAIKCYDKVIELNPNHNDAWNNKADAFKKLGKYDELKKMIRWEICEIRAKTTPGSKNSFSWLDDGWHMDYVLYVILINKNNMDEKTMDIIMESPPFHAFGLYSSEIKFGNETFEGLPKQNQNGSIALNILRANLMSNGWERMVDVNGMHWYSDTFRRRVEYLNS